MGQATLGGDGPTVWTLGYEKQTVHQVIERLRAADIGMVLDVREQAWSRKPGFAAKALEGHLELAGIRYLHLPALGAVKAVRDADDFDAAYVAHLDTVASDYAELKAVASRGKAALLCLEADPKLCHRRLLAHRLIEDGFQVIHL